jgi:fucose permease
MIALAPPAQRGRIMGFYTSIISAGFAAGPLCLLTVGTHGWPPFLVGIGAFIVCGACLASVLGRLPRVDEEGEKASVLGFLPLAWLLLAAVVVAAGYEQAMLSLMPVYGAASGLSEASVSALLTAFIAGNIALQIPLGLLAERLTARMMLFVCSLASAIGSALIPVLLDGFLIWPVIFVLGAVSFGIYTMALIELGQRFSGTMLVAANSAFSLMWGVGGIVVSPAVGISMDLMGPGGLPISLTLTCLALSVAALRWRSG